MFGHDNDDTSTSQTDNQAVTATEPADDGTLALPATDDSTSSSMPAADPVTEVEPSDDIVPVQPPEPTPSAPETPSTEERVAPEVPSGGDDLVSIKQRALQQLKPLVGHLEQTPEERFRTTMMMIQAADDQSLIAQAYESANDITDEKTRAQALLDVVNEINYFSSQKDN
jgi:hypothetical protein